jgi:putative acetyltransferase
LNSAGFGLPVADARLLGKRALRRYTFQMQIREDDLSSPEIRALLALHLAGMHENSPPGSVYALDLSGLQTPDVTMWSVWDSAALMGCGALKQISPGVGEIKSMRTAAEHLRKGVATALLTHMILAARERGYRSLCLETGSGPAFEAALALYRAHGFVNGPAFGDYEASAFNQFLHLKL